MKRPQPVRRRLNFHHGMVLGTEDLRAEQAYHRDKQRRHNRELHGSGIVSGLDVEAAEGCTVHISPGYALSPDGDEILVEASAVLEVPCPRAKSCFVVIRYDERLVEPVPSPAGGEGATEYAFVEEGFVLDVVDEVPDEGGWVVLASVDAAAGAGLTVDAGARRRVPGCATA